MIIWLQDKNYLSLLHLQNYILLASPKAACSTISPQNWACAHNCLVDHPTQLICIWIFICWVGGGDPCGAAELCISGPCSQKKQARTDVFSKYLCHVHKDCLEAKTGTTNWVKPPKKELFVSCIPEFLKWGIPQNGNFQNEGSLNSEIPKRGKVYNSAVFCKKYQASINVFQY